MSRFIEISSVTPVSQRICTKKSFYIRQPFKETIDGSGSSFGGQELVFEGRGSGFGGRGSGK